jgi:aminopeptidase N
MRSYLLILIVSIFIVSCNMFRPRPAEVRSGGMGNKELLQPMFPYRPSKTLLNDLLHTKLEVKFDWTKKQMSGKATLTLKPYIYSQSKLELDAKGFDIRAVQLVKGAVKTDLVYQYDTTKLTIMLDKTYSRNEPYTIFIDYTAKPEELKTKEGDAITSDKGLFFIIPDSANPDKPYQIWTQSEPESASYWFPTIDSPNEKTTQEIFITVENKYKTLSNGELIYSTKNMDGTRTDYWKMDLPHSPYLFMMAVGDFSVTKDQWNGKEVSYYVEPKYGPYARSIFGTTPEMINFFSSKLNYPYPWLKYSSIIVRDYVSGAMENTSATIFMEQLQKTDRELLDQNWENIIAHELFHHWFGDLVTCESWANLPLNESFATYAEYLWEEHKRGEDAAEMVRKSELDQYLQEAQSKQVSMIRYQYKDIEDMFDSHSYAKGSIILHMLRKYTGDVAFFEALNLYLKRNEFKSAEIHNLRLAFEEVTKEDLNWFFNQWFLAPGHPELEVTDKYSKGKLKIKVLQKQDTTFTPVYKLPVKVDVWVKGEKKTHNLVVNGELSEFNIDVDTVPDLVLFDSEQQIVGKIEHRKTIKEWIFQYSHASKFTAREKALERLTEAKDTAQVVDVYLKALEDPFWKIRQKAVAKLSAHKGKDTLKIRKRIKEILASDKDRRVKIEAIERLGKLKKPEYEPIFLKGMNDSSYALAAASLLAYLKLEPKDAQDKISKFEEENNADYIEALSEYYSTLKKDTTKYKWFLKKLASSKRDGMYMLIQNFGTYIAKSDTVHQGDGMKLLENFARNNKYIWLRYSAYQAMMEVKQTDAIKATLKDIRANEKEDRLKEIYKMYD